MKDKINHLRELFLGLIKKLKRHGENEGEKSLPKFRFHRNFWMLVALIPFALLFTQALISSVSAVVFIFIILLPLLSLGYMGLGIVSIKLYLDSSVTETEKMKPVSFSLALSNESPLPYPFVEAVITTPSENAVRSDSILTMLSLIPFGSYVIDNEAVFKYRGAYDIGVSDLYIYDPFHFFSYRVEMNLFRQIFVYPRQLVMPGHGAGDISVENTDTVVRRIGSDNTETADIRAYVQGDSLRSIHWKLSEKTEELMVRQYSQNSETQTFIFCDSAKRFENDDGKYENDINEFAADGAVEAAIAIVKNNLERAGNSVTLAWFDSRSVGDIAAVKISSLYDFEQSYNFFATSPVTVTDKTLLELYSAVAPQGSQSSSLIFISANPGQELSAAISTIAQSFSGQMSAYIFTPADKVLPSYKKDYFVKCELCTNELSRMGVDVKSAHFECVNSCSQITKEGSDND